MRGSAVSDAELIERLREPADDDVPAHICKLMDAAADRLEALTAQKPVVKPLEWSDYSAELKPFGLCFSLCEPDGSEGDLPGWYVFEEFTNKVFSGDGSPESAIAATDRWVSSAILSALAQAPVVAVSDEMVERAVIAFYEELRPTIQDELRAALEAALSTQPTSAVAGDGSRCDDCHAPNPVWFAPNHLWNRVMGGEAPTDDPGGIVCVHCFIKRAEAAGIKPTAWVLDVEQATTDQAELPVVGWIDEKYGAFFKGPISSVVNLKEVCLRSDALRLIAERDEKLLIVEKLRGQRDAAIAKYQAMHAQKSNEKVEEFRRAERLREALEQTKQNVGEYLAGVDHSEVSEEARRGIEWAIDRAAPQTEALE